QTLPSSQSRAGPPTHVPFEQASFVVHAEASSQDAVLFVCTHPLAGLHESSVQPLPSLQSGGGPPTHDPFAHVSFVVHASPSVQVPAWHASLCVQALASLHAVPSGFAGSEQSPVAVSHVPAT